MQETLKQKAPPLLLCAPQIGTWLLERSMFIYKLGSEVRAQIVVSTPPRHDFENVGPFGYTFFRTCSLQWGVNPFTMFPPLKCKWDPATAQLKHCTPWSTAPFLVGHNKQSPTACALSLAFAGSIRMGASLRRRKITSSSTWAF